MNYFRETSGCGRILRLWPKFLRMLRPRASATPSDGGADVTQPPVDVRWPTVAALTVWAAVSTVLTVTTIPVKTPRAGLLAGGEDLWVYREAARNVTAHLDL